VLTVKETLRYRGAIGQWSWVLHRLTGLGVVFFLFLHVIDTSFAVFNPAGYEEAIAAYQSPLFTIGEFFLIACVVYHALNGLRIVLMDFKPDLWKYQEQAAWWVLGGTVVLLVPTFTIMITAVFEHYGSDPFILPLSKVLAAQLVFVGYFIGGAIAAATLAFIVSAIKMNVEGDGGAVKVGKSGSRIESFWWSFMRISGLLIIPLVFGHLAMMHVLQGVFDITLAGTEKGIVAVAAADIEEGAELEIVIGDGYNASGTATEFVAERWGSLRGGLAFIKFYDGALLILVVMHGFNGLRLVMTDYTMDNLLIRRTMVYLTIIGGVALIVVGLAALLGSIDLNMIDMAQESLRELQAGG
jgi:succinate dehydrogenase cytochrome b subunit